MADLLKGRRGLVIGIANNRSIAYGIARSMCAEGAELALTYQHEQLARRVIPIGEELGAKIVAQADVENADSLDKLFDKISTVWGKMDFLVHAVAFSDRNELAGRFMDTSRENFQNSMTISCYSLIELVRRSHVLMPDGGSILTITFQGSNRVTPFYNVMGVAKAALESSVRYLANDLGSEGIRVNAISPGPMKTLAGAAIAGARRTFRHTESNAPLGSNATLDTIGGAAVFLASDYGVCTTGEIITVDGGFHILGMPQSFNL